MFRDYSVLFFFNFEHFSLYGASSTAIFPMSLFDLQKYLYDPYINGNTVPNMAFLNIFTSPHQELTLAV